MPPFEPDQLFFAAGDKVVFSSEADGRNYLYAVSASGGSGGSASPATLLTPGDFDVYEAMLSPDKHTVLLSTNQGDVDRRHIWAVAAAGGEAPQPLSHDETIEWTPVVTVDGHDILCLGSTAVTPPLVYRLHHGQRTLMSKNALPKDFPSAQLVAPKQVLFQSPDGLVLHAQFFSAEGPVQTRTGYHLHARRPAAADDA